MVRACVCRGGRVRDDRDEKPAGRRVEDSMCEKDGGRERV